MRRATRLGRAADVLDAARGDYRVLPESPAPATWTTAQDVDPGPADGFSFDTDDAKMLRQAG